MHPMHPDTLGVTELRKALEISTSMMEAMMMQLYSWDHEPTVNVRGQMEKNRKLLMDENQ